MTDRYQDVKLSGIVEPLYIPLSCLITSNVQIYHSLWFYGSQHSYVLYLVSVHVVCCYPGCLMFCLYHVDRLLLVLFCTMYVQLFVLNNCICREAPLYTGSVLLVQPFPCDKYRIIIIIMSKIGCVNYACFPKFIQSHNIHQSHATIQCHMH